MIRTPLSAGLEASGYWTSPEARLCGKGFAAFEYLNAFMRALPPNSAPRVVAWGSLDVTEEFVA
jgi:hypothetical protein